MRRDERTLREAAALLRTREENLLPRLQAVLDENRELQRSLQKARLGAGGDVLEAALGGGVDVEGFRVVSLTPEGIESIDELKALGDRLRERLRSGVGVLAMTAGKPTLVAVVTDDLVKRGIRADAVVREVAAAVGGKGGGKPHLAQASIVEVERVAEALARVPEIVRGIAAGAPA
jgi:alanyl-tRNA synthetase